MKGISGYTVRDGESIYVPVLISDEPGKGNVGRYINELIQREKCVKFPNVINPKLVDMLVRRGFKLEWEYAEEFGEHVEVYVWRREKCAANNAAHR